MFHEDIPGRFRSADELIRAFYTRVCRSAGLPGTTLRDLVETLVRDVAAYHGRCAAACQVFDEAGGFSFRVAQGFSGAGDASHAPCAVESRGCNCSMALKDDPAGVVVSAAGALVLDDAPASLQSTTERGLGYLRGECLRLGMPHLAILPLASSDHRVSGCFQLAVERPDDRCRELVDALGRESDPLARMIRQIQRVITRDFLLDQIAESVILLDARGSLHYANKTAARRFGIPREQVIGRNIREVVPAEIIERRIARMWEKYHQGSEMVFEDTRDRVHYRHQTFPELDPEGNLLSLTVISTDVTALREAEATIRERSRADRLLTILSERFARLTAREFIPGLRNALMEIGGFMAADAAFVMWADTEITRIESVHAWVSDDLPEVRARLDACRNFPAGIFRESCSRGFFSHDGIGAFAGIQDGDRELLGGLCPRSLLVFPLFRGGVPSGVIGALTKREPKTWSEADVTVGRLVSRILSHVSERVAMERELRRSQALLQAVVSAIPLEFFMIDREGRYCLANDLVTRHYGDLVGRKPADLAPNETVLALWLDNNRRALSGEEVREEQVYEIGGRNRCVFSVLNPVKVEGTVVGAVVLNLDLTDFRRLETEFSLERQAWDEAGEVFRRCRESLRDEIAPRLAVALERLDPARPLSPEASRAAREALQSALDEVLRRLEPPDPEGAPPRPSSLKKFWLPTRAVFPPPRVPGCPKKSRKR
ncbi:MAG: PAS domain-containing protein [Acidobacteria bacterium]|nr:PAS domain-containing protein [Acidobacteriota bacterium]